MSPMIFGSRWVPVLDERWLHSPTMLQALRRRAEIEVYATQDSVAIGPERLVIVDPEAGNIIYLVYPIVHEAEGRHW